MFTYTLSASNISTSPHMINPIQLLRNFSCGQVQGKDRLIARNYIQGVLRYLANRPLHREESSNIYYYRR